MEEEEEEARTRRFAVLAVATRERSAMTVLGSVPEDVSVSVLEALGTLRFVVGEVLEALGTLRFVVGAVAGREQSAVSCLHSKVLFVVEVARQEVQ